MPTYEYVCQKCGHRFELFQKITDPPRKRCPECRGAVRRIIGAGAGFLFKGNGFYITDYRSKDYREKAKSESKESKKETKEEPNKAPKETPAPKESAD